MAESCSSKEPPPDIYNPLDKDTREIRLFEILPSEDINATVEIRLFRRRLEDVSGQFIPFSYVWGDARDTKPIKVNGIPMAVTRNLADFLKQTRALLPDILTKGSWDKPAIFWADAICINQQDTEERNHQVQFLKSIYSSTPLALAWLGHCRDAHLAASLADLAESLSPLYSPDLPQTLPNMDYSSWMQAYPHLWVVSEGRNAYWEAFNVLVDSQYWTRTWTFQEMVLPTDVLLICGSSLIMWQSVVAVQQLMIAVASTHIYFKLPATVAHRALYSALAPFFTSRGSSTLEIYLTRTKLVATSNSLNLTLVPRLVQNQATDPRDKVYGLLGVIGTRLEADYKKDTAQVYKEFVSAWIDEVKDLDFLLYSYEYYRIARHGPKPFPSWAPDWEAISQKEGDTKNHLNFGLYLTGRFYGHDASKHLPARNARLRNDDLSALVAPGVVAGKVEEVFPRWLPDTSNAEFALKVLELLTRCTSCLGSQLEPSGLPPGPRQHIFQALFRTIIPDMGMHSSLQNRYAGPQRSIAFCVLVGVLAWAVDAERPDWHRVATIYLPQLGIPPGQDFSRAWREEIFKGYSPEHNMPDWEEAAAAMEWTWENARGRRDPKKAGDLVVVLAGCQAPVLLRRKGSYYEHVGPCYVAGLMEGKAKQMVDRGEAKIETFEIR